MWQTYSEILSTQQPCAQIGSSEKNLVNTELQQEVPKVTSRALVHHPKKFQHVISGEYLPNCVFGKLPPRSRVTCYS